MRSERRELLVEKEMLVSFSGVFFCLVYWVFERIDVGLEEGYFRGRERE